MLFEIAFVIACVASVLYLVLCTLVNGVLYAIDMHHEHLTDYVIVSIAIPNDECPQNRPLQFVIQNTGDQVVQSVTWSVIIKKSGFSSNQIEDASLKYEEDKILKPNEIWSVCYEFPNLKKRFENYSELTHQIVNKTVLFE